MSQRVLVLLAEGFEEIEAVTIVDVLRRAGLDVTTAGLAPGLVRGSHGIAIEADTELARVDGPSFDVLVLPGGQPGSQNLAADPRVSELIRALHGKNRTLAAICAAPSVLARAGVLEGVTVTSHPSVREELGPAKIDSEHAVVRSGNVVTSQGAGTALEFALELAAQFSSRERADELARAMIVR
jgi:4-methyl-5(b-hydroxyethyl)-thiazole monophosphate biosynthesis